MRLLVVAPSYRHARIWSLQRRLRRQDWQFVASPDYLTGHAEGTEVVWVGSGPHNSALAALLELHEHQGMFIITRECT
jgi:NADPH-dependent glutamate synthase beta subunit-like oxidoreductase